MFTSDRMIRRTLFGALLVAGTLMAAGCQLVQPQPAPSTPAPLSTATLAAAQTPMQTPDATPVTPATPAVSAILTATATTTTSSIVTLTVPLAATASVTQSAPPPPEPVLLAIPEIDMEAPVATMGWEIVLEGGERMTRWALPDDAAGWHVNSARAGEAGNTILSGSQRTGAAVFAPLALGEVKLDQEIVLTDSDGRSFVYRVAEISDPLPLLGGGAEVERALAAYLAPSDRGRLTLISGWPDFTTTHRLVIVADLIGPQK